MPENNSPENQPKTLDEILKVETVEILRGRRRRGQAFPPTDELQLLMMQALDETEAKIVEAQKALEDAKGHGVLGFLRRFRRETIREAEGTLNKQYDLLGKQEAELVEKVQATLQDGRRTQLDLVGLAFSGGGIRSATFNLGILQSLADLGLLQFCDYLSTISGGGYIGSWFTGWIRRQQGGIATVAEYLKPISQARQANTPTADERRPILHLRRYSNYLTPRLGLFSQDTWTGVATYIRNLLLNQLILIPALAALLLIPRLLGKFVFLAPAGMWIGVLLLIVGVFVLLALFFIASALNRLTQPPERHLTVKCLHWGICVPLLIASILFAWLFGMQRDSLPLVRWDFLNHPMLTSIPAWLWWGFAVGVLNLVLYLIAQFLSARDQDPVGHWAVSALVSGFVGGALLYGLLHFGLWPWSKLQPELPHAVVWGPPLLLIIFLLAVTIQVGLRGITEPDEAREWRASMGAWLLIYALAWTGICAISFYGPLGWNLLVGWATTKATLILGWVASTVAAILAGKSSRTDGSGGPPWLQWVTKICPVIAVVGLLMAIALGSHTIVDKWSSPESATTTVSEPHKTVQGKIIGTARLSESIAVAVDLRLPEAPDTSRAIIAGYWEQVRNAKVKSLGALLLLCLLIAGGLAWTVDVNEFSLHAAYRNRLVRCYLGASRKKAKSKEGQEPTSSSQDDVRRPDPITDFDPSDDFQLAELSTSSHYDGPYPIINTALNLTAGEELAWQERKASSFILTPRFCGSQETGYCETEGFSGGVKLGTALAISGAAASPNMGYHTSAPIAFLLTLFNVRLGWWVGNPAERKKDTWKKTGPQGSLFYLLTELFGQTGAKSQYIYLSDGGHFENLGIYELVRRRCKYIVCCDAGADPRIGFEDLGKTIRQIRADQGVDIEIDLDMVRPQAGQRYSRWHHAIGIIRYDQADPGESVGMLIYIKASITGDESGDVLEYADHHASFPHQSTADQFFDESQFESYRKLGEHIAWEVFRCAQIELRQAQANGKIDEIFNAMRHHWVSVPISIRDSFLSQKEALVRLEAKLCDDPRLARYDAEIYPELEAFLGANPTAWPALDPRGVLHFCTMQLELMENIFVALEFEKYHSYALNRGWMNLFRRWAMTPTLQKLWPGLRGGYSRRFVDFVEEQLIPCEPFKIVGGITSGLVLRLVDEFRRDQLSAEISPKFPDAMANPLTLQTGVRATWFAVPAADPEGKDVWNVDEAWGAAVVTNGPTDDNYQLFVWVRGACRNLGVGGKLLDRAIAELRDNYVDRKILVDLGEEKPGSASYRERKGAWLRFYGQRGFIREHDDTQHDAQLRLTLQLHS